ncbi:MAG: hypothetical protein LQ341_005637 [Variospora aurantia]|nr:MAG: hypothetical protein LQ341_005637 [Variospora aurantia]
MIGESTAAYLFIRGFVTLLRTIAPLSIVYCFLRPVVPYHLHIPRLLETIAVAESLFYFLIFLPWRYLVQRPVVHPAALSPSVRRELFRKCLDTVPDIRNFLRLGSEEPQPDVRRENVKEWFCWAFMNRATWDKEEDDELEEYVRQIERLSGEQIPPGRGEAKSLRITLDSFTTLHRPLIWYIFMVGGHDLIAHTYLSLHSFHLHRRPLTHFLHEFPLRPLSLFSSHVTPANKLTYYHHPHTSTIHLPVVLIHGVGIGLHTYMRLMSEFVSASSGTIGFIALEIMPISFRLTHAPMRKDELCAEILAILDHHGYDRFVIIGQSFGTIIAAQMLHHAAIGPRIASLILFDPVTFLLHLTEMAYNFTRRRPRTANQHQLYYFASTDIGIAHTLARCTFWSESILWKEELEGRRCTVVLGARDIVVAAEQVGRYLTREKGVRAADDKRKDEDGWKRRGWTGKGIDVLWFEENDHGEIIDTREGREVLIRAALEYSKTEEEAVVTNDTTLK